MRLRIGSKYLLLALGVAAAAAAVGALPALGDSAAKPSATKSVSVRDDFFSPRRAEIARGGKVVWRWKGDNAHNVRFRKVPSGVKRPKGSDTQTEGRFARTFGKRGTYRYVCTIHEDLGMTGRVVVGG
jgi:plastocyanin